MLILIQNAKHEIVQIIYIQCQYFKKNWLKQIVLLV